MINQARTNQTAWLGLISYIGAVCYHKLFDWRLYKWIDVCVFPVPWIHCLDFPANCLQVTSATNGSAAECTLVEEEPWKHE